MYTIIMNWSLIAVDLTMGIAQAPQPLIGNAFGKREYGQIKDYLWYTLVCALLLGVIFEIAGFGFTHSLVGVFTSDSEAVVREAETAFRLYLPAYILMDVAICSGTFFQAVNAPIRAFLIMAFRGIVLPVLLVIALPYFFGATGLWLAVPIAEMATSLAAGALLVKASKRMDGGEEK